MPESPALIDGLAALTRGNVVPWAALGAAPADAVAACDRHGVTALAHRQLSRAMHDWPEAVVAELASRACGEAVAETLRKRELTSTIAALASAGIATVLLKGSALAYTVYSSPSLRPRNDTDLLVSFRDVDRVRIVMQDLGYAETPMSGGDLLFAQIEFSKVDDHGLHHAFDFHWKISTQPVFAGALTFEEVFADAVPVAALGPHALVPRDSHALLLACIHPVMHHRNAELLIWVHDISLLANRIDAGELDSFVEHALSRNVAQVCAYQLRRAQTRFAVAVASSLLARLDRATGESSAAYLRPRRRWLDELASSMRGLPHWRDRLEFLREIAFPDPRYMWSLYGGTPSAHRGAILPALYALRIAKGIGRIALGRK